MSDTRCIARAKEDQSPFHHWYLDYLSRDPSRDHHNSKHFFYSRTDFCICRQLAITTAATRRRSSSEKTRDFSRDDQRTIARRSRIVIVYQFFISDRFIAGVPWERGRARLVVPARSAFVNNIDFIKHIIPRNLRSTGSINQAGTIRRLQPHGHASISLMKICRTLLSVTADQGSDASFA